MPNKRDLILDSYEISKNAYRELCYFCLQYPEKKQKLNNLYNPLHAMNYDGMPHGNSVGEPTAIAGERAAILSRDCEMIERAAKEADHEIAEFILLAVTQDVPYHYLTAEAWGMHEGDLFRCEPYLQIQMVNGSHSMWVPSINDVLAEDWAIVD
jgi:hypothetical protein